MTLSILIEQTNGRFTATLAGAPSVSGVAETRSGAVAALETEVRRRLIAGELTTIEIETQGISHLSGRFADDPSLREICADAYAARDAERPK